jgi:dTDP-4-amino-4,6-dideoxygalactose transaminase
MTEPRIPQIDLRAQFLRLRPRIEARIAQVLESGQFILGPQVGELEQALAAFVGIRHAVSVGNGTDALRIGLAAQGVQTGDAVFVPAFTFVATAEAVVQLGAEPVFVDLEPDSLTMDPRHLADCIAAVRRAGDRRPSAVVPVDIFGLPADYGPILALAADNRLSVVADAAQSFGGSYGGRRVGAIAPVTATSFYPTKPLGGYGDGGCLFTDDDACADAFRRLRHHGALGDRPWQVGGNSRLDTLQAAILLAKLEVVEEERMARERAAAWYDELLPASVRRPTSPAGRVSSWAYYSILLPNRDAMLQHLADVGIEARVYYAQPIHRQPAFARYSNGALPVTERASGETLSLPLHADLDRDTVARVCRSIRQALP